VRASERAEQVKRRGAERAHGGLDLFQPGNGFVSTHAANITSKRRMGKGATGQTTLRPLPLLLRQLRGLSQRGIDAALPAAPAAAEVRHDIGIEPQAHGLLGR